MEDYFDDFEDDFDEGDFMDEDSFEDSLEGEMDEPFTGDSDHEEESDETESQDDKITAKDAFIIGGAMGWAYSRGLKDEQFKQRKKNSKQNIKDN